VTLGRYLEGLALLTIAVAPLVVGARAARRRLHPSAPRATARVAEAVIGIGAALLATEALGFASLLYPVPTAVAWALTGAALVAFGRGATRTTETNPARAEGARVAVAAASLVAAQWGTLTISALRHGMVATDTLRYHEPVAARFVQEHSIDHLHFLAGDPVNTFLPFNSELLHSAGMLFMGSDVLSPIFNLGWLALALGAAWAIGRPRGLGAPVLLAAGLVLATPMAASQAGSGNNDVVGVALVLAALAIALAARPTVAALGLAGLAAGIAAGTKPTLVPPALLVALALVAVAPAGRRLRTCGSVAAGLLAGGGAWYLRDQVLVGNFLPWWHIHVGPIDLPAPPRPPGTTVAHYAGNLDVVRHVFVPGLDDALGPLWWAIAGLAALGVVLCLVAPARREQRAFAAAGGLAAIAYTLTPNTANGPEGFPVFFAFTVRYAAGALAIGLALAPLSRTAERVARSGWALAALSLGLVVTVVTGEFDKRTVALLAVLLVLLAARRLIRALPGPGRLRRAAPRPLAAGGVAVALLPGGWAVTSNYLDGRYSSGPYAWANGVHGARIAVAGSTKQYQLYGRDLSNRVQYIGRRGPHGAFGPIAGCREWRRALAAGRYGYVVVTPPEFLEQFTASGAREERWTAGDPHATVALRPGGRLTVFRLSGPPTQAGC
jgi:hypothetical protein